MIKILTRILMLLSVGFISLNGSCEKDSDPKPGPKKNPIAVPYARFLCTIGRDRDDKLDTLVYRARPFLFEPMSTYNELAEEGDKVKFISTGSNSNVYRIVFNTPFIQGPNNTSHFYLGIGDWLENNPQVLGCNHSVEAEEDVSEETDFIVEGDATGFTIESKLHRGNYLQARKWKNATYPTEAYLVFCPEKRTFFFLDK